MNARLKLGVLLLAAVLGVVLTAALGFWQLSRAAQKQALQAAVQAQAALPALDNVAVLGTAPALSLVHRHARLQGTWLPEHTVFLDNRPMDARVGFWVLTPLRLAGSNAVVVVQRGWVPRNFEDRVALPRVATPGGAVDIEGRIAPSPSKLYELGGASSGPIRQNLDLVQFRAETGLPLLAVTLQQTGAASEGLTRAWAAPDAGVDRHYGYAFQWFGLSALIAVLFLWFQVVSPFIHRPKDPSSHG